MRQTKYLIYILTLCGLLMNVSAYTHAQNKSQAQQRIQEVIRHLSLYQRDSEVIRYEQREDSVSGLYLPENTGNPQGGVLILHDIAQHAHWPFSVAPLREYLPDYGWSTLSLFFQDYIAIPRPKDPKLDDEDNQEENTVEEEQAVTEEQETVEQQEEVVPAQEPQEDQNFADENTDEEQVADETSQDNVEAQDNNEAEATPEPEEPVQTEEQRIDAFIADMADTVEGGLQQLNTLGQFNLVVVANGLAANWAAEALKKRFETSEKSGYVLVLINAKQSTYPEYPLNQTLAELDIPMLDIHTHELERDIRKATARRNAIVRRQNEDYWQIAITARNDHTMDKHNPISRRVRGWLKTHAAGKKVDLNAP